MGITQSEYNYLIQEDKAFEDVETSIKLGPAPIKWKRIINTINGKETFLFDFYRGSFEITKYTYNKRYRQTIVLLRYDNGGRHTNPDGQFFDGPHVHLYREGYDDKFAFPIFEIGVSPSDSMEEVFKKIAQYCNIITIPTIEVTLF